MTEIEQFCILAKSQKGLACSALLQQVFTNKKIFNFGELLSIPSVQALKASEFSKSYKTLELFAYGTYKMYKATPEEFIDLSESQLKKLKLLSLVSLCLEYKVLPYSFLREELDIQDNRLLEKLIIDAIYNDLVSAKLNQEQELLRVTSAISRDVSPSDLNKIIKTLNKWEKRCDSIISTLDSSLNQLAAARENDKIHDEQIKKEIINIKESLNDVSISSPYNISSINNANNIEMGYSIDPLNLKKKHKIKG